MAVWNCSWRGEEHVRKNAGSIWAREVTLNGPVKSGKFENFEGSIHTFFSTFGKKSKKFFFAFFRRFSTLILGQFRKNNFFRFFANFFKKFSKVIKYTCFSDLPKIAILRARILARRASNRFENLYDKTSSWDLFNAKIRSEKFCSTAEDWSSQNRHFSDFRNF